VAVVAKAYTTGNKRPHLQGQQRCGGHLFFPLLALFQ